MTNTATPTATDWTWNQVTFAVLTSSPRPSEYRPTYSTMGHAHSACPAITGRTIATDTSLDLFLAENEFFDGEVEYRTPWPCGTCVPVRGGRPAVVAFEAPRPALRPAAAPAPRPVKTEDTRRAALKANVYPGTCRVCKGRVAANAGRRERTEAGWTVLHTTEAECAAVLAAPAPAPKAPAAPLPQVPDGKYAVTADAGHSSFYEVRTPTEGKWAGYVFVDLLIGSPGSWRHQKVSREQRPTILAKIAQDPQEAMARYGREFKQCGACDSPLSHDRSKKAGYGQVCAEKRGWAW